MLLLYAMEDDAGEVMEREECREGIGAEKELVVCFVYGKSDFAFLGAVGKKAALVIVLNDSEQREIESTVQILPTSKPFCPSCLSPPFLSPSLPLLWPPSPQLTGGPTPASP